MVGPYAPAAQSLPVNTVERAVEYAELHHAIGRLPK